MIRIGIRADGDAGGEAGMGHVYRSLAYARKIKEELPDVSIRFFMRDFPEGLQKAQSEGYEISILPIRPIRSDFEETLGVEPPHLLIIDTLGSSSELIETARELGSAVITVDDLESSAAEADVIVNGILWATRLLPDPFGKAKVYQGAEYIQLREQFAEAHQKTRTPSGGVSRILISTGGADGREFAIQLMEAVRKVPFACSVSVVVGPANQNTTVLEKAAKAITGRINFSIVNNASDMAGYLSAADLALITGGTIMFESAASGTPAVVACSYEHQVPQAEWFAQRGTALNLGYFPGEVDCRQVAQAIESLAADHERLHRMSQAGKATVDGRGLERFVKIVGSRMEISRPEVCR